MKTRRDFLHSVIATTAVPLLEPVLAMAGTPSSGAQPIPNLGDAHKGTPEIDARILARSEPPKNSQAFFAEARQLFEANPMATFAELPGLREAAVRHGLGLLGGPLLGALSPQGARVWVRTLQPAQVEVVVKTTTGERTFGPVASTIASDLSAVIPVTGLEPATTYPYSLRIDGKPVSIPSTAAIRTPAAADQPGRFTFAFGSCFHKTGLGDRALLERIHQRGAQAFLTLGDCAVDDRQARVGLHRSDYLLRDLHPGWQTLAASTAVYASWDDHDYFDNDLSGVPPNHTDADRDAVRKVWKENWNNPAYGFEERKLGIFFRTRLGPCDLIMLDTRSRRTKKGEPDSFLGAEQMRWLEQELTTCTAPFVILTSGTMWSDQISKGKDSWGVWDPAGREKIFALIEKLRLPVVLFSGDRHGARVVQIPRPSGHCFWEFEPASLGAHTGPAAFGSDKSHQPFGEVLTALFGECTVDTTAAEPTATFRLVDAQGSIHWERTLSRREVAVLKF